MLGVRTLSEGTLIGLYFIQKYRFLTIAQFGRIAGFSAYHAAEVLRGLERWGLIGYFGYVGIPGQGKTPKVYYLRRKGFDILCSESHLFEEIAERFTEVQATWTPQMYHRLRIIDVLISAEIAIRNRPHLRMVKVFVEYRIRKKKGSPARETTDFVSDCEISENKLVPDSAFIMENIETTKRALFFVEMDMATERIVSRLPRDTRITLKYKISQYDRYLKSMRYKETYLEYGEFRFFTLLFVTLTEARIENILKEMQDLPADLAQYYRFTTYDQAMGDFLGAIWKSRLLSDKRLYPLVR
jgi:protein involved in plasmid replication-relaxation